MSRNQLMVVLGAVVLILVTLFRHPRTGVQDSGWALSNAPAGTGQVLHSTPRERTSGNAPLPTSGEVGSQEYESKCREEFDRLSISSVPELNVWHELYTRAGVAEEVLYTAIRRTYVATSERKQFQASIDSQLDTMTRRVGELIDNPEYTDQQRKSLTEITEQSTKSMVELLRQKSIETLELRTLELVKLTGVSDRRVFDLALSITPQQYAPFLGTNAIAE